MARVTFDLPALLAPDLDGVREVSVEASTLAGALEELYARHPVLRQRLVDETGAFREHVLCIHEGVSTRWMDGLGRAVADGDRVQILQAVSGG